MDGWSPLQQSGWTQVAQLVKSWILVFMHPTVFRTLMGPGLPLSASGSQHRRYMSAKSPYILDFGPNAATDESA